MIVEVIVAAGKKEQARAYTTLDGDRVVATQQGASPAPADIVFTVTPPLAQELHDGTLDLSVGFMRGQVKMAGDFGRLLEFLPLTAGESPVIATPSLLPEPA